MLKALTLLVSAVFPNRTIRLSVWVSTGKIDNF